MIVYKCIRGEISKKVKEECFYRLPLVNNKGDFLSKSLFSFL